MKNTSADAGLNKPYTLNSSVSVKGSESWRVSCYALLVFCDIFLISISFLISNYVYLSDWWATHGVTMIGVSVPIFLWAAIVNGAYSQTSLQDPRVGAFKAVQALIFAAVATLIIAYSFKVGGVFSRFIFWIGTFISLGLLVSGRLLVGRRLLDWAGDMLNATVVLVDGVPWQKEPRDTVIDTTDLGFNPMTDDPHEYDMLAKKVGNADRVLVACSEDRVAAWARALKSLAVDGEIVTSDVDRIGVIGVGKYGTRRTLVVSAGPLHLRDRFVKRAFDITLSLLALLLLSPLLILISIAIRLETPGPVLFRQQRIGRDNALFMMFKFRSMYTEKCDPSASVLTSKSDSRVTKVGDFIRRNSIDELPQLFNVIRGEMSIVGPRPHALSAKAAERLYWEIDERYRYRHVVKPGVTGLAQIRGYRGATVQASDLTNRLSSDLEYLRDWSMSKDIWIIFRTIFVIRHDNAF